MVIRLVNFHLKSVEYVISSNSSRGHVPAVAQAHVLNTRSKDKTMSGLWPSYHASVYAKLRFDDDSSGGESSDD